MTKKEKLTEKEALWRQKRATQAIGISLIVLGLAIMAVGAFLSVPWNYTDKNHITDPNLPIKDYKNATFTWTYDELVDRANDALIVLAGGAGFLMAGYVVLLSQIGSKRFHKDYCTKIADDSPWKFCPECGSKLSEFE